MHNSDPTYPAYPEEEDLNDNKEDLHPENYNNVEVLSWTSKEEAEHPGAINTLDNIEDYNSGFLNKTLDNIEDYNSGFLNESASPKEIENKKISYPKDIPKEVSDYENFKEKSLEEKKEKEEEKEELNLDDERENLRKIIEDKNVSPEILEQAKIRLYEINNK